MANYVNYRSSPPVSMCANCNSETTIMCHGPYEHVICERCDSGNGCIKCNDAPDSDEEDYLIPTKSTGHLSILGRENPPSNGCDSCHRAEQVTNRCHDCDMDICDICVEQHSVMTFLKSHRLSPKLDVPQSLAGTLQKSSGHHLVDTSPTIIPDTKTLFDLLEELKNLDDQVKARKTRVVSKIDKANKDIQERALTRVGEMLKEADEMKNEIDERVQEQTRILQKKQKALLSQLVERKNFIRQQTEKIEHEISSTQTEIERSLQLFTKPFTSTGGYTTVVPVATIAGQQDYFQKSLDEMYRRLQGLTFQYTPPTEPGEVLGKIDPRKRLQVVSSTRVKRFERENEYVVTGLMAAPGEIVVVTSCKGERKVAIDLVDIRGNVIGTRKVHDPSDESKTMTPAFGAIINNESAILAWDKSVSVMEVGNQKDINSLCIEDILVPDGRAGCLAISHELGRIALGNDKSRIIILFNFKVEKVSSVTLKEEGHPPKSLAFFNEKFLVTDGVKSAFLADPHGSTIVRFPNPKVESRPLAIDSSKGVAYVLWENDQSPSSVQFYSLFQRSLGEMIGRYLTVQNNPSIIAAMPMSDQEDGRLITVNGDGKMFIYRIQDI